MLPTIPHFCPLFDASSLQPGIKSIINHMTACLLGKPDIDGPASKQSSHGAPRSHCGQKYLPLPPPTLTLTHRSHHNQGSILKTALHFLEKEGKELVKP